MKTTKRAKITHVFLRADLRCSHRGLKEIAHKDYGLTKFRRGELMVFLNNKQSMAKILCGSETVIHLRPASGQIDVEALAYLPEFLGIGSGELMYSRAVGKWFDEQWDKDAA